MKKLLITLLVMLMCFTSCGKKEEEPVIEPTYYSEDILIIVKKDSGIEDIDGLKEKTVGIQEEFQKDMSDYVVSQLNDETIIYKQYPSYHDTLNAIASNEIDAFIISKEANILLHDYRVDYLENDYSIIQTFNIPYYEEAPEVIHTNNDLFEKPFLVMLTGLDGGSTGLADAYDNYGANNDVDTLMVVDPVKRHVLTVSFPRDSYMYNVGLGKQAKMTSLGKRGVDNIAKSVGYTLDCEIPYYCQVSFQSFIYFINAIGGVWVDVPLSMTMDQNSKREVKYPVSIEEGENLLFGEWALALARNRKYSGIYNNDYGRIRNQALLINSIIEKIANHPLILDMAGLGQEWLFRYICNTNFSNEEISDLIELAKTFNEGYTIDNYFIENTGSYSETGSFIGLMQEETLEIAKGKINMILNGSIPEGSPYYDGIYYAYQTGGSGTREVGYKYVSEYDLHDIYN